MRLDRYAAGETLVRAGERPANLSVVTAGHVALTISLGSDGDVIRFEHVGLGEPIGLSALTGELSRVTATAVEAVTVLQIPITVLDTLLRTRPQLARQLSDAMDEQRRAIAATLSAPSAGGRSVRSDRSL
jgi:CRP-like cAMP-binding protein